MELVGLYITYSDIFGKRLPIEAASERIAKYNLWDILNILSRIDLTLGFAYNRTLQAQIDLSKRLYCLNASKQIYEFLKQHPYKGSPRVLFHEQQILNAIKLSIQNCSINTKISEEPNWEPLCEALLIISDHLIPPALAIEDGTNVRQENKGRERYILMNGVFHEREDELSQIVRWYELAFESFKSTNINDPDYLDLENTFRNKIGLSPKEFFAIGLLLYAGWMMLKQEDIDKGKVSLDLQGILKNFSINKNTLNLALQELSAPLDWFCSELGNNDFQPFEFLPFQNKPLLKKDNQMFCLSKGFLTDKITSGLYHTLLNSFSEEENRKKFLRFFGKIYEKYLTNIFEKKYNPSPLAHRFFSETKYKKRKQEEKSADGIIDYGDSLVVMEFKASLLSHDILDILTKGDRDQFTKKFEDIIFGGAEQLHKVITKLKSEVLTFPGIDRSRIKRYFPLIITLQPFPMETLLYKYIWEGFSQRDLLQDRNS